MILVFAAHTANTDTNNGVENFAIIRVVISMMFTTQSLIFIRIIAVAGSCTHFTSSNSYLSAINNNFNEQTLMVSAIFKPLASYVAN